MPVCSPELQTLEEARTNALPPAVVPPGAGLSSHDYGRGGRRSGR